MKLVENFKATPDRYFLEMGKDVKEAIRNLPITPAFKKERFRKNHW